MGDYGFISFIPVLIIMIVAITTRRTLLALFSGSVVGAIILTKTDFVTGWIDYFYTTMQDETVQWVILLISLFGALIHLFEKSGAVTEFSTWLQKFVNSRKKSLVMTYILGFILFLDDYLNNLVVGSTMKKLTDRYKVPRTLLGYIVNTTAAPVAVLIPLSTWAIFFAGLLENEGVTVNGSGMGAYIHSLPFIFYAWISLIMIPLIIFKVIPMMGPTKVQNQIAMETGNVFPTSKGSSNTSTKNIQNDIIKAKAEEKQEKIQRTNPFNFLIPMLVLIVVTIVTDIDVLLGTIAALFTVFIMYLPQKRMTFTEMANGFFEGLKSMFFVVVLICLAFIVQNMNLDLQIAEYIISITEPLMNPAFLPVVIFIVSGVYAYATGCFWDLAAIITPIVIPLAMAMNVDPILAAAAIFSGAAFGSNTCLYGDAVILASESVEVQPVDLMKAILPYALIGGAITVVLYLITGFVMI